MQTTEIEDRFLGAFDNADVLEMLSPPGERRAQQARLANSRSAATAPRPWRPGWRRSTTRRWYRKRF
jgi:hypothetical protein